MNTRKARSFHPPEAVEEETPKESADVEVAIEESPEIEVEDESPIPPMFRRLNELGVTIYAIARKDGVLTTFSLNALTDSDLMLLNVTQYPINAVFSVPSIQDLESYRVQASVYNAEARGVLVQRPILRRLLVSNHLQKLEIPGVDLEVDRRGHLTKDSVEGLDDLHPSIIDLLVVKFTDVASLIM